MDGCDRKQQSDVVPDHKKDTINAFFCLHVPISPNKRDAMKIRHPKFPSQFKVKQAMHRFETMDELWLKFRDEHTQLADRYMNEKKPNTCPRIIRDNAPWEMRKATSSSCLCSGCEGMNACRRGVTGACAAIDDIAKIVQSTKDTSDESISRDLVRLIEIKEIISQPSKYDTIVACLQPCLSTNKLEDAKYSCLNGQDCSSCGFRRLWSNGLRKTLLCSEVCPD